MAFLGGYRAQTGVTLPRVVTLSVSRTDAASTTAHQAIRYSVRMHEEGTPISWRRDVTLQPATQLSLRADLLVLDEWTQGRRSDPREVTRTAHRLGRRLYDTFLGAAGSAFLAEHPPTALMVDADETALHLPWELLFDKQGPLVLRWPFGRIVSTRTRPRPQRDPVQEDTTIAVLAVVDPSKDMRDIDEELSAIRELAQMGTLTLDVLQGDDATHDALAQKVSATRFDVVHFSGHGGFAPARPGESGLVLADGPLRTRSIVDLPWAAPPSLAIMSACWSARSAAGRRLSTAGSGSNGVAAAFLAGGAAGCLGFGWPVTVRGASRFIQAFYPAIVERQNVGLAVLEARRRTVDDLWGLADLAGFGAVFYGDVGTAERRDAYTAA